ncbi:MAG: MvdC/MvdD family ATP grasp protein [Patescibacteria group bacterium]
MKDAVLILTSAPDVSVNPVIACFEQMDQKYLKFNTETFPRDSQVNLELSDKNLDGMLRIADNPIISLMEIKSCWYRGTRSPENLSVLPEGYFKLVKEESTAALWSLYTTLETFWMNKPVVANRLLEHNKFFQLKCASRHGLLVPRTIITNDPKNLLEFCRACGGSIAVKMLKGHLFVDSASGEIYTLYTNRVSEDELRTHFESIRIAPVFAQEYIPKKLELRITIVGNNVFTCAIHSQDSTRTQDDWRRYDFGNVRHEQFDLPNEVRDALLKLMKSWDLSFGAIDMILTPEGQYVFLEINPSGQWGWIEELTGMPISRAIAELLSNPPL